MHYLLIGNITYILHLLRTQLICSSVIWNTIYASSIHEKHNVHSLYIENTTHMFITYSEHDLCILHLWRTQLAFSINAECNLHVHLYLGTSSCILHQPRIESTFSFQLGTQSIYYFFALNPTSLSKIQYYTYWNS